MNHKDMKQQWSSLTSLEQVGLDILALLGSLLFNKSIIDLAESKDARNFRNPVAWFQFHERLDMVVTMDIATAEELRVVCRKCHMWGHKGYECRFNATNKVLVCPRPNCGRNHHLRDCYRDKGDRTLTREARKPHATSESGESSSATTRIKRSEREKRFVCVNTNYMKTMWKAFENSAGKDDDSNAGSGGIFSGGAAWRATNSEWDADDTGIWEQGIDEMVESPQLRRPKSLPNTTSKPSEPIRQSSQSEDRKDLCTV
jgi:hypothetical protein